MRIRLTHITLISCFALMFVLGSCKSEFERIRTGGDTERIYSAGMDYYEKGEYLKAQTLFELIISTYRGKKEAEDLFFKYAYTHYYLEQYILAAYYFKSFAETFTNSEKREDALFMSAYTNYELSPSFRLDQEYTTTAIDQFQIFVNTYPNSPRVEECNKLIDELRKKLEKKAVARAELYYNMGRYKAAVQAYTLTLQDYPETDEAEDIRYKMAKAEFNLAENSVYSKKRERYETTLELANTFLLKYPRSEYVGEVRKFKQIAEQQIKSLING